MSIVRFLTVVGCHTPVSSHPSMGHSKITGYTSADPYIPHMLHISLAPAAYNQESFCAVVAAVIETHFQLCQDHTARDQVPYLWGNMGKKKKKREEKAILDASRRSGYSTPP